MTGYSPALAIVTGLFEFSAAVFVFLSPGRKRILYPSGLLLLLLAGYQFAEVAVCANPGRLLLARIAYFDITWLPPVGLWLALQFCLPKRKWVKIFPLTYFAAGAVLSVWLMVDPNCVTKTVCDLVIARYSTTNPFEIVYAIYYQSGLVLLIFGSAAGMAYAGDAVLRKHLVNLQTGVLGFLLPSLVVRLMVSQSRGINTSVMCHFALVLAVSLFVLVLRERRSINAAAE
jgi:hypothetical protein